ncbi:DUF938 domain-containing protein [Methylicorpusculum sp.]|uniref:DUF938 domain-containing protein n=1 Tax=Methylicorpusculum sp. TaxID=2713644 RepID=UPI00272F8E37|nr:DUF938 domain-containing protein [Methylicorpusculum sp.]MDP2177798.1 DUF938 domain-containing protein [Methylicorpusculum sp.]MDP3528679.1 DUF938 domain-containing protein [Methylicorpusculum sp.]MDZ4153971.1 DUF938 domain-containing protein [Methylicorpusculum sp.]
MNQPKPFSQACENNKGPILHVLRQIFVKPVTVWEIGSGTGQHACYFAGHLPHVNWQPTDRAEYLPGIEQWITQSGLSNLKSPVMLDVNDAVWPCTSIEALFTANTLHIMSWQEVTVLFVRLKGLLAEDATVCIYGPFNYNGQYTSASNELFDHSLKARDLLSGIRDFEAVVAEAQNAGLNLVEDHAMPANNRLLVFQKSRLDAA